MGVEALISIVSPELPGIRVPGIQGPHTLRIHLQNVDHRTRQVYLKPNPSNAGTKHLSINIPPN